MNETTVFLLTFIIYIISAVFYFSYLFTKRVFLAGLGYKAALVGLITHTVAIVLRTIESNEIPWLRNDRESRPATLCHPLRG